MLRRVAAPLGYGTFADLVSVVLALLIPAGIVAAVVVLVVARRAAAGTSAATAGAALPGRSARPSPRRTSSIAAAIAAASVVFFLVVNALGLGDGSAASCVLVGAAIVAVAGIVVAVIVALRALLPGPTTSLRTRAFFVIAIAVLIPSLCLAALGVWAYYRSWDTATALSSTRRSYRARSSPRRSRRSSAPGRFSAAERARLSRAIAAMYGVQGHPEGAQLATLGADPPDPDAPGLGDREPRAPGLRDRQRSRTAGPVAVPGDRRVAGRSAGGALLRPGLGGSALSRRRSPSHASCRSRCSAWP